MRKKLFIILNLFASIIEVIVIIMFLVNFILKNNFIYGVISISIYIIFLIAMIFISFSKKSIFETLVFPEKLNAKVQEIYKKFKEKYPDRDVVFNYVKDPQFIEPAAYLNGIIYVNANYKISPVFIEGVIAHELGHAKSNLIEFKWLNLIRITSLLARLIYTFRFRARKYFSKYKLFVLDLIFLTIYNILNVFDHVVSNPFFRKDELLANSTAVEIGFGESLRYFYYNGLKSAESDIKFIAKYYDYKHPSITQMLAAIEKEMNLSKIEKEIVSIKNKIYIVKNFTDLNDKNYKIVQWYQFKAKQNIDYFLYDMGYIYLKGRYNTQIDTEKAMLYFRKAKDQGFIPAYCQIGLFKYNLDNFTDGEAYSNLKFASENNYKPAYKYYANCLAYGLGIKENLEEAHVWYEKAANNNDREAKNYLKVIGNTYIYEFHSNKLVSVDQEIFKFNSIIEVKKLNSLGEENCYSAKFLNNFIILFDESKKEYTRFTIVRNKIIRKNVEIKISDKEFLKTSITYIKLI